MCVHGRFLWGSWLALILAAPGPVLGEGVPRDTLVILPPPDRAGHRPLEGLLQARESVRGFASDPLTDVQIGQLLWAAGGTTHTARFTHRTIPSAGALYPLEYYLVTAEGVARYNPAAHALHWIAGEDRRGALAEAALQQKTVAEAPAVFVIAAEASRTTVKYGERGHRYVTMEVGFAAQNLLLEAVALELGAVPVGAFRDSEVDRILELPDSQRAWLIIPVGVPRHQ